MSSSNGALVPAHQQMTPDEFYGRGAGKKQSRIVDVSRPLPLMGTEYVFKTLEALSGAKRVSAACCSVVDEIDLVVDHYYTFQTSPDKPAIQLTDAQSAKLKASFKRDEWNNILNWPDGLQSHVTAAKQVVLDLPVVLNRARAIPFEGPLLGISVWGIDWDGTDVQLPLFTFGNSAGVMCGYPASDDTHNVISALNDFRNGALNSGAAQLVRPLLRAFAGVDIVVEERNLPHVVFAENLPRVRQLCVSVATLIARSDTTGEVVTDLAPFLKLSDNWRYVSSSVEEKVYEKNVAYKDDTVTVRRENWVLALDMDYRIYLPVDMFAHRISLSSSSAQHNYEFSMFVQYDELERTLGEYEYESHNGVMDLRPVEATAYRFSERDGDMSLFVYEHNNQPLSLRLRMVNENARTTPMPESMHVCFEQTWNCIPPVYGGRASLIRKFEMIRERHADSIIAQLVANRS